VVGTFGNGNIKIYKNGFFARDGSLGTTTIHSNNESLGIGAEGDGGTPFSGTIDDVRIYDKVLSGPEVWEIANPSILDPNSADLDDDGNVNLFDFTLLADNWHEEGDPLVINEFMASNSEGSDINDLPGDNDDWIEIYNTGSETVDIGGMYITDNLSRPTKWQIPDDSPVDTTISPYGYLLIWADKETEEGPLHVEFKLDGGGEEIGLFDTDGNTLVDSIVFDDQVADVSYGRYPDSGDMWRFMGFPTPKAQNNAGYLGQVADTEFSHDRGFYVDDFNVTITCDTSDAEIHYTIDGSMPTEGHGNDYVVAIPIGTTTSLRTVAFKPGWLSSNVDTQTYIFLDDVIKQATDPGTGAQVIPPGYPTTWPGGSHSGSTTGDYQVDPDVVGQDGTDIFGGLYADTIRDDLKSVPTISLVMDKDDWFGSQGIYINESQDHTERVASFEFMDPSTSREAQINCAMSMQGGGAGGGTSLRRWKTYKCSMRPRFKIQTDNGTPTGGLTKLNFKIFGDSPIERYDTVVIDGVLNHSWLHPSSGQRDTALYIQDQYVSDLHNAMDGYSPYGHYAHIYINGLYWGMYYIHDRPDHSWAAEMFGGDKDEYDAIKHSTSYVINDGGGLGSGTARDSFDDMFDAADDVSLYPDDPNIYDVLCQKLDIDNFITYLLSNWFCGTTDWAHKNWYATHHHPDGLWRFHTWDAEHTLEGEEMGDSPYKIHDELKGNAEYRMRFADLAHRYFFNNGVLSHPRPAEMYQARMDQIDRAIVGESARWGDNRRTTPYTRQDWLDTQNNKLAGFFPGRSTDVLNWLKNSTRNLYPDVNAPVFYINGSYQHGGQTSTGDELTMTNTNSSGTIWYTIDGNDPRLPATGSSGTILVAESAAKRVLVPTSDIGDGWRNGQPFDDSQWNDGTIIPGKTGGVGFEIPGGYEDYITYDVQTEMYQQNDTCYIRIPFTFSGDPDDFDFMTLRVRYDDGFIAYLNGVKIAEDLAPASPQWNSTAPDNHSDSLAVNFVDFSATNYINDLQQGDNILAIHALNCSCNIHDFLISVELVAGEGGSAGGVSPSAIEYTPPTPVTLTESTHVKARVLDGAWSALNEATFAVGPVADNLRITEMMYHPLDTGDPNNDPNAEFIELTNIGPEAINLSLVRFTEGIRFTFPNRPLGPGEFVLLVKDRAVFDSRYTGVPPTVDIFSPYEGRLSNGGERIRLEDAIGEKIHDFEYKDGWRPITDGDGFSLNIIDPTNSDPNGDPNDWGEKDSWRASDYVGGSAGEDTDVLPNPGAVVINEVLAHSHLAPDWIELYNTTSTAIDIGGWFLSDNDANLMKYRIPDGTTIAGGGSHKYLVYYEDLHFGDGNNPDCNIPFAFSENGEEACLSSAEGYVLTGYREVEDFGASETGVSFGRYFKNSTGNYNFVAMDSNTPGGVNDAPQVGPIVINEIMYHPDWPEGGSYNNDDYEYIELHNITGQAVTLYDFVEDEPWKFTDGIEFTCPNSSPVAIPAGGYLLVVKNPAAFAWRYPSVPLPPERILGPYGGQLRNSGERVEFSKPGDVDELGVRHYIRVDRVNYSDGWHPEDCPGGVDQWPKEADGGGKSLSREVPTDYGNDVINWDANEPSPGVLNP
jgi:hypothetical protein